MYQDRYYYVYIMASRRYGTLYVGVTNDVLRRSWEHKQKLVEGFTKKHGVDKLVYYETFTDIDEAIRYEKRLKRWHRTWKIELIQKQNPEWRDLYDDLVALEQGVIPANKQTKCVIPGERVKRAMTRDL